MPDETPAPERPASSLAFDLNAEQQATLESADVYARRELYPLAARMDAEEWWPAEQFARLGRDGYLGVTVPERYGGGGADLFASGLVLQAMARWNHALALAWVAHDNLCVNNIFRNADETLRRRYLPGLCSGAARGRAGTYRAGRRLGCPRLDALERPPAGRSLSAERH